MREKQTSEVDSRLDSVDYKIYVLLLESREPLGVREIARLLDLPVSTVHYHIRKLRSLGLIREGEFGYVVDRVLSFEDYLLIRRRLIPRLIVYSFFFLGVFIGQLVVISTRGYTVDSLIALITSLTAFSILLFEGYKLRKRITPR